jgi:hypothetical protein
LRQFAKPGIFFDAGLLSRRIKSPALKKTPGFGGLVFDAKTEARH